MYLLHQNSINCQTINYKNQQYTYHQIANNNKFNSKIIHAIYYKQKLMMQLTFIYPIHIYKLFLTNMTYNLSNPQQIISPWTIYDQHGKKIQHNTNSIEQNNKKIPISQRLLKKQTSDKLSNLNHLLSDITSQKRKLTQKINLLTALQIIKHQLYQQTSPINNVKINLPKIKQGNQKIQLEQNTKNKHRQNYYSQKINIIKDNITTANALQDFSKIFISKSYHNQNHNSPQNNQQDKQQMKFHFAKFKKRNKSLILPKLENLEHLGHLENKYKNEFTDHSIHQIIETVKQNFRKKNNSLTSLVYD